MDRREFLIVGLSLSLPACERLTAHANECQMCRRPVHAESRTVAAVNGKPELFCCLACAIAAGEQGAKSLKIERIADYDTRAHLDPARAFLVRNSDVNPCSHKHSLIDASKHPSEVTYDRCSPSVLAFGSRQAAQQFMAHHGGALVRLADLR